MSDGRFSVKKDNTADDQIQIKFTLHSRATTWLETVHETESPDPRWGHTAAPWKGVLESIARDSPIP